MTKTTTTVHDLTPPWRGLRRDMSPFSGTRQVRQGSVTDHTCTASGQRFG
ncbi:hypothetical protein AU693_004735 [Salmonella enterica subsp. diarizonae]|nr:hypothetical protein [Salmonella enterica subsp. diarizonae]